MHNNFRFKDHNFHPNMHLFGSQSDMTIYQPARRASEIHLYSAYTVTTSTTTSYFRRLTHRYLGFAFQFTRHHQQSE